MSMETFSWKNRNVFVTGITGFLGSHLARALVARGANVVGLIRDRVPRSFLYEDQTDRRVTLVEGNLEDLRLLERALGEHEIDTVFHVAAQAIVGVANRNPISTFRANIEGTWNLLEACRRSPLVRRIVVASSDKAYGDPVCITRCGNLYGPGDLNFNRIIPQTIRRVQDGESPVIRSDGTLIRDYFYVEDAVSAYLTLAEQIETLDLGGEAFNFSNEAQMTVREIVARILTLMHSDLPVTVLNEAGNEIRHQYLSAEKARSILGWRPAYTVEEGLARTIPWYQAFLT